MHQAIHAVPPGYRDTTMTYAQLVTTAAKAPVTMDRGEYRAILAEAGKTEAELQSDVDALANQHRADFTAEPEHSQAYTAMVCAMADDVLHGTPFPITEEEGTAILAMAGKSFDDFGDDLNTLIDLHHQERMAELKRDAMFAQARVAAEGYDRLQQFGY